MEREAHEQEEHSYQELLKYLRNEPNDITPGTSEMLEAEIAAKLVSKHPDLIGPANREKLQAAIQEVYQREERERLGDDVPF